MNNANRIKRYRVWNKYKGHCAYCGNPITKIKKFGVLSMEMDHIVARSCGGISNMANLNPSCHLFNSLKGAKTIDEFKIYLSSNPVITDVYEKYSRQTWNGLFYFERKKEPINQNIDNLSLGGK